MIKEWDHELAQLAEMNVKNCVFDHDKCRNTGYLFQFYLKLSIYHRHHRRCVPIGWTKYSLFMDKRQGLRQY